MEPVHPHYLQQGMNAFVLQPLYPIPSAHPGYPLSPSTHHGHHQPSFSHPGMGNPVGHYPPPVSYSHAGQPPPPPHLLPSYTAPMRTVPMHDSFPGGFSNSMGQMMQTFDPRRLSHSNGRAPVAPVHHHGHHQPRPNGGIQHMSDLDKLRKLKSDIEAGIHPIYKPIVRMERVEVERSEDVEHAEIAGQEQVIDPTVNDESVVLEEEIQRKIRSATQQPTPDLIDQQIARATHRVVEMLDRVEPVNPVHFVGGRLMLPPNGPPLPSFPGSSTTLSFGPPPPPMGLQNFNPCQDGLPSPTHQVSSGRPPPPPTLVRMAEPGWDPIRSAGLPPPPPPPRPVAHVMSRVDESETLLHSQRRTASPVTSDRASKMQRVDDVILHRPTHYSPPHHDSINRESGHTEQVPQQSRSTVDQSATSIQRDEEMNRDVESNTISGRRRKSSRRNRRTTKSNQPDVTTTSTEEYDEESEEIKYQKAMEKYYQDLKEYERKKADRLAQRNKAKKVTTTNTAVVESIVSIEDGDVDGAPMEE